MSIITSFPNRTISANISDVVIVSEDPVVDVSVIDTDSAEVIAQASLAPYNGRIRLCRIRDIIEDYMRAHSLVERGFSVSAGSVSESFYVLFCAAAGFDSSLGNVFLSQLPTQRVFSADALTLSTLICDDDLRLSAQFWAPGHRPQLFEAQVAFEAPFEQSNHWAYSVADIDADLRSVNNIPEAARLSSITAQCGYCVKSWFVADGRADIVALFHNAFNCPEILPFKAKIKSSLDIERQSGRVEGRLVEYLSNTERVFEVESEFLTLAEAEALEWALMSHSLSLFTDGHTGPVVVSDVSTDIDNDNAAERKVKFSFRPADPRLSLRAEPLEDFKGRQYDIFTQEFTPPFL